MASACHSSHPRCVCVSVCLCVCECVYLIWSFRPVGHLNVEPVWRVGVTGKGVLIAFSSQSPYFHNELIDRMNRKVSILPSALSVLLFFSPFPPLFSLFFFFFFSLLLFVSYTLILSIICSFPSSSSQASSFSISDIPSTSKTTHIAAAVGNPFDLSTSSRLICLSFINHFF